MRGPSGMLMAALLAAISVADTGCRGRLLGTDGPLAGALFGGGLFGGNSGQRVPWSGGGRSTGWNTPQLGGGGSSPLTPPPDLVQKPVPLAPTSFDSDTQSVLARYNASIGGPWATPENVQIAIRALQLYPPVRQHPLQIVIGPDEQRRPLSGLWVRRGNSATVYLYQPTMRSTPPHEVAHDVTLMVQPNEGAVLRNLMGTYGNVPSAFARNYSYSNDREFAADALSYWARRVSGLDPSEDYNPPAEIVRALQPMLIEGLRTN
ncbi:MAG: hypothetical protein HYY25_06565 [Candidatus Wallbacteria bacterium]|nr:hypothetical protein [Candidatus Wallbacteria bacterium]